MQFRGRLLLSVLGGGIGCLGYAATPAAARVELEVTPGLRPAFQPDVTDYVSRCRHRNPIHVTVRTSAGERVSVAGRPERSGTFAAQARRRIGAQMSVRARVPGGRTTVYHVRCLPPDFPDWTAARHGTPQAQWYVAAPVGQYVAIFDTRGAPVWWRRGASDRLKPWDAKLLGDGTLVWGHDVGHFGTRPHGSIEERTLDGRLVRRVRTKGSPTDMHDLQQLPNGHFLGITYRPRDHVDLSAYGGPSNARVFDGEIQELTPAGRVVWRWNSASHISPSETGREWWYNEAHGRPPPPERGYDLLHMNSVEPDGDGLVVSARHLNAVFHIDRATGDVDWKLGGSFVRGRSLTVLGMPPAKPVFTGQHDARLWKDGTLTVYDNRAHIAPPLADRFRIDPVSMTATRIEAVGEPDVRRSDWGGSARKLPGGNWVVCWGATPWITEQTPAGAVVFSLHMSSYSFSYRTQGVPPGVVSGGRLRRAMDRMARRSQ
ncbi:MAG: hypothetical protein QOG86_550 [Thermoleophilaceae bacterium]|nr:hypothetical protein [Thermoleophilaceae bacterium]